MLPSIVWIFIQYIRTKQSIELVFLLVVCLNKRKYHFW